MPRWGWSRYALLRPEFARLRAQRAAGGAPDGVVRRLLVCFGGSDPANHTAATLEAIVRRAAAIGTIDVVIGNANPHRERLADLIRRSLPTATLHVQTGDIARLLAAADLAIGAGGTMNWERACLGVPTLAFGIADNQTGGLETLIDQGYVMGMPEMRVPDPEMIAAWLACLLDNPPLLRGLARRSAALVDGLGSERVADAMLPAPLAFRAATLGDCEDILAWRNSPEVRRVSLQSGTLDPTAHRRWMERTLDDPRRILLIAEADGIPAGVVRFDLTPPEALMSVYRTPGAPPRTALIRRATEWLRGKHPEIRRITAEVLPDNAASLAAFRHAGYRSLKNTLGIELDQP